MPVGAKRQSKIATFFGKTTPKKENEDAVVVVDDSSPEPPTKRRKRGSSTPPVTSLKDEVDLVKSSKKDKAGLTVSEKLLLDNDYPPPDHPSYHPPPGPTYNHPIEIARIPDQLLSSLKFNTVPKPIIKPELGLELQYFKRFIDPSCSVQLTKYLLDSLPWYRVKYKVRGIDINTPRYTTVFGKDSTTTPWTGYDKAEPRAIPRILLKLMQQVEEVTGMTYNFALVNYYSSGNDSISYHSDSESFLGPNPCIASLSLGGSRDFMLRHVSYQTNKAPIEKFNLTDGDMVVMRGRTQHDWQHSIPKRKNAEGRINITFRKGIVKYATQNYYQYNVGKGPLYRWEKGQMVEQK